LASSELNQREYCEAYEVPLKAFGNWRAKFKAEPQTPARKVLYRRGGLSHTLSHGLSHDLSIGPTIPPAREGRRRMFSESDKQQILEEAMRPGARLSEVARRYGIAERVLFRWKQEMMPAAAPTFVAVEITDADQERFPARHGQNERLIALGRKNHLFAGSDGGGVRWATIC
jgi:hypothetical protein